MANTRQFNIDALNDLIELMSSLLGDMQAMHSMLTVAAERQADMAQEQQGQGAELVKLNAEMLKLRAEMVKLNARMTAGINVKTVTTLPPLGL